MSTLNLTLLTDLYELTMMQGYYESNSNETVIFDAFYRKNPCGNGYAICCRAWIRSLIISKICIFPMKTSLICDSLGIFHAPTSWITCEVSILRVISGRSRKDPSYSRTNRCVKVIAPIMQAQLVETAILNIINHQSLIATKTARVVHAARGDGIMEFGLRRAQGPDAGVYGARAAMIGGCIGTSNVLTGQLFDVPVKGTHAHSWIMSFPDEYTAFKKYSELYPNACLLLVDTYDTLRSGVPNAIRVFQEMREAGQ